MQEISIISNVQKRQGAYLPHWRADSASYFVTFRLAGSLPFSITEEIASLRRDILQTAARGNRSLSSYEQEQLEELHFRELDILRIERGASYLRDSSIAQVVSNALTHFNGERYHLFAWSIMPTHVHVVFQPCSGWEPSAILHSWKSFTANAANRILKKQCAFWQSESYDHLIRGNDDLHRCIAYTWLNPDEAKLKNSKWRWKIASSESS